MNLSSLWDFNNYGEEDCDALLTQRVADLILEADEAEASISLNIDGSVRLVVP